MISGTVIIISSTVIINILINLIISNSSITSISIIINTIIMLTILRIIITAARPSGVIRIEHVISSQQT